MRNSGGSPFGNAWYTKRRGSGRTTWSAAVVPPTLMRTVNGLTHGPHNRSVAAASTDASTVDDPSTVALNSRGRE